MSAINTDSLHKFFNESLEKDNFDGLGHLINYLETRNIDITEWDLSKFRSSLDFYLNHSFDVNKIFTFLRFYVRSASSNLNKNTSFESVFGPLESVVDMPKLFKYLVHMVGNKTFVDP